MTYESNDGVDANVLPLWLPEVDPKAYAKQFVGDLTTFYSDLGSADEFVAILGRHVQDLELVIAPTRATASHLAVRPDRGGWVRQVAVSEKELKTYTNALYSAFVTLNMGILYREGRAMLM